MKRLYTMQLFFISVFAAVGLSSQEALKSTEEEYYDFLSLQGIAERPTLNYRTLSDSVWNIPGTSTDTTISDTTHEISKATGNVWASNNLGTKKQITDNIAFKLYGPDWFNSYNSGYPYGQNDGALWQGKGYNTSITAGARLEAYGIELTIKPQVCFSQNNYFEIMKSSVSSQYGYFWGGQIDLPQRFGDSSFWTFDWGDTEIRYTRKTLTAGFGTQSPWLGPAWLNPMLGSNNAATYPKFDVGIRKTSLYMPHFGWYIGDIEARMWLGYLSESDYFDDDDTNNHNMLTALSVAYAPSFIPGLTLGLNRVFNTKWKTDDLQYIGRLFTLSYTNDVGGDGEDQKVSFTLSQLIPSYGLEFYGEVGIDDFTNNATSNLYHTMIYTVGTKKEITLSRKHNISSEFIFEFNDFVMSQDFQLQWPYMGYYSHGKIIQGYTQRGQIIGAGSGYAGTSLFLGYKIYYPKGSVMPYFHLHSPDANYVYSMAVTTDADSISEDHGTIIKTYKTLAISAEYFVTSHFLVYGEYAYVWVNYPMYDKQTIGLTNNRVCAGIKIQF